MTGLDSKISIKDLITILAGILSLAGVYTALKVADQRHDSEIEDLKEDIERLEQRDEWFTRELEMLR